MKTGKFFKKNEEEMAPRKKFEVIDGGLAEPKTGGKEPPTNDWLTPLGVNTVFLGKQKRSPDPILTEFTVLRHSENCVQLKVGDQGIVWMDPGLFCVVTDLKDILHEGDE